MPAATYQHLSLLISREFVGKYSELQKRKMLIFAVLTEYLNEAARKWPSHNVTSTSKTEREMKLLRAWPPYC